MFGEQIEAKHHECSKTKRNNNNTPKDINKTNNQIYEWSNEQLNQYADRQNVTLRYSCKQMPTSFNWPKKTVKLPHPYTLHPFPAKEAAETIKFHVVP